jgi:Ser/Thr protein kinase RdoA (MazF antagonist)
MTAMPDELTASDLRFTPPQLPWDLLEQFLEDHWGITGTFKPLSGERDQNIQVCTPDDDLYVLKVSSPIEDPTLVDFQVQAMLHLERVDPTIPIPRVHCSLVGNVVEILHSDDGEHVVRLLSWVDGVPLEDAASCSPEVVTQIGSLQGRMCKAFAGFRHAGGKHFMPWNILNGLVVSHELRTRYLRDGLAERCGPALQRLENETLPRMLRLPAQTIHNDGHWGNVLCDPGAPDTITGVIDFGDQIEGPLVVDLATSMTSVLERSEAPLEAAAALVEGFESQLALPQEQRELLYDATLARAIMIVQLLEFRAQHTEVDPELRDVDIPIVKQTLERILCIDPDDFLQAVRRGENE